MRKYTDDQLGKLSKQELIDYIAELKKSYGINKEESIHPDITYKDLVECASDIIFVINADGSMISHNSSWFSVFPNEENLPMGQHYSKYIRGIDIERAEYIFDLVINKGESLSNEIIRIMDKEENKHYFSSSFTPIKDKDGTITGILGAMRDVTHSHIAEKELESKTAILEEKIRQQILQEQELKGLHEFNHDIIRHAPVGIFMMDPTGIMISENPKLKELMGHGRETRIGINLLNYEGFIQSGFADMFKKCITEKKPFVLSNIKYVPISRDRELIITLNMFPIIDHEDQVEKVICMVEDNTEEFMLTQRVNNTQRKAVIGAFSYSIADSLRKDTNQMVMDINFVSNNIPEDSPAREYVFNLKRNVDKIQFLAEQMKGLSITQESEKDAHMLSEILENFPAADIISDMKNHGITVNVNHHPQGELPVWATATQLQNLFKQIMYNAQEAMNDGGTINIDIQKLEKDNNPYSVLQISDTGIGIPEDSLQKIFKPFFTTKGKTSNGLGLMIVCFILDNLNGVLGVKSVPGEGTTVRISLPNIQSKTTKEPSDDDIDTPVS